MPRKNIQAPLPRPVLFLCLNCDQPMTLIRQVKLFCSEACADEAKLVRYARRCISDGRINQPDVQEAIQIRIAHALSGGYSERERRVPLSVRRAVFDRDGGRCQGCGRPGTDIDTVVVVNWLTFNCFAALVTIRKPKRDLLRLHPNMNGTQK